MQSVCQAPATHAYARPGYPGLPIAVCIPNAHSAPRPQQAAPDPPPKAVPISAQAAVCACGRSAHPACTCVRAWGGRPLPVCNRHRFPAALAYVPIGCCIQCNCLHSYIAPGASSSTASSGAVATFIHAFHAFIKHNRRHRYRAVLARPPLLAWPAPILLGLCKHPGSAGQPARAPWLAVTELSATLTSGWPRPVLAMGGAHAYALGLYISIGAQWQGARRVASTSGDLRRSPQWVGGATSISAFLNPTLIRKERVGHSRTWLVCLAIRRPTCLLLGFCMRSSSGRLECSCGGWGWGRRGGGDLPAMRVAQIFFGALQCWNSSTQHPASGTQALRRPGPPSNSSPRAIPIPKFPSPCALAFIDYSIKLLPRAYVLELPLGACLHGCLAAVAPHA